MDDLPGAIPDGMRGASEPRRWRLAILALMLAAALPYLYRIDERGWTGDDTGREQDLRRGFAGWIKNWYAKENGRLDAFLQYAVFRTCGPTEAHLLSIAVHALNVALFACLAGRLLPLRAAWLAAAVFGLHPQGSEVIFVAGGMNYLVSTSLLLVALNLLAAKGRQQAWAWGGAAFLMALGLGLFEQGLMAAPILALLAFPVASLRRPRNWLPSGLFCLSSLAAFLLQGSFEHDSAVPVDAFPHAHRLRQDLNGKLEQLAIKGMQHCVGQAGVIQGAVTVGQDAAESGSEGGKVVAAVSGQGNGCQLVGIDDLVVLENVVPLKEAQVKAYVVPDHGVIANEVRELLDHFLQAGGVAHHLVGDAGELGNEGGDGLAGIDQGGPFIFHAVPVKTHSGDLQDGILEGIKAGGFNIDGDHWGHGAIITRGDI